MRLVGATEYLVSAPFYLQGLLQGIIGGIFAFLGVSLLAYFVSATLISFSFPSLPFFLLSLTVGAVLGISGSYVALSRIKETEK
jgi:cell division protein FtsX